MWSGMLDIATSRLPFLITLEDEFVSFSQFNIMSAKA